MATTPTSSRRATAASCAALAATAWLVAGCSTTKVDETANWSPNKIYS
ncbi:outer membrane protein assembly factor BamD, partial [Variovorax sp. N23]|nr:outer membrane protein assembly factor BamD [Variovorax sp. N23]